MLRQYSFYALTCILQVLQNYVLIVKSKQSCYSLVIFFQEYVDSYLQVFVFLVHFLKCIIQYGLSGLIKQQIRQYQQRIFFKLAQSNMLRQKQKELSTTELSQKNAIPCTLVYTGTNHKKGQLSFSNNRDRTHFIPTQISMQSSRSNKSLQRYNFAKGDKKRKVFNMQDSSQNRLKRQNSYLYQKSFQQSKLFEKGIKRIDLRTNNQNSKQLGHSGIRKYNNGSSYDILRPTTSGEVEKKGGLKKIDIKNSSAFNDAAGIKPQPKKYQKKADYEYDVRKQSKKQPADKENYIVQKLPGHKNSNSVWLNKSIHLTFTKKANLLSQQNKQEVTDTIQLKKGSYKTNQDHLAHKQGGIVCKDNEKQGVLDFKQSYYKTKNDLKNKSSVSRGYLSARCF